jgi:hypothetical protein
MEAVMPFSRSLPNILRQLESFKNVNFCAKYLQFCVLAVTFLHLDSHFNCNRVNQATKILLSVYMVLKTHVPLHHYLQGVSYPNGRIHLCLPSLCTMGFITYLYYKVIYSNLLRATGFRYRLINHHMDYVSHTVTSSWLRD